MKLYTFITIWGLLFGAKATKGQVFYEIVGKVYTTSPVNKIYLYQIDKVRTLLDSSDIVAGKFTFKGTVAFPISASLQVKGIRKTQDLYLENAAIEVELFDGWKRPNTVIGGLENNIKKSYKLDSQYLQDTLAKIGRSYEKSDEEGKVQLGLQLQDFNRQLDSIRMGYLRIFPNSLAVLDLYKPYLSVMNYEQLQGLASQLDTRLGVHGAYQELQKQLEKKKSENLVGKPAPKLVSRTNEAKEFNLDQLKGKLVLLDFWASWCAPCRIANRKLVATYQKYKDKGFEVVSYSMDNKEKLWLDAIKKDGIPWIQLSDLTGFEHNAVAPAYHVKQLPSLFLIDEKGVIIEQHIDHEQLLQYLKRKYEHE